MSMLPVVSMLFELGRAGIEGAGVGMGSSGGEPADVDCGRSALPKPKASYDVVNSEGSR
jgi:hypothetical protein